jgi:two-component system, NarL family, sensor histidine kinase UhpB
MVNLLEDDLLHATNLVSSMGESLTRFNFLSKTTSEGVWDFNLLTGAVYYNETIYALLGYSAKDMQDNYNWWRNNIHPNDKERVIKEIDILLESRDHNWWGEYAFRCKNGLYKNVFERLYVVRDNKGKATRIIGTMMDLDPITKLHGELQQERLAYRKNVIKMAFHTTELERKEISDELHENINQVLAAINLHMEAAKKHIDPAGEEWLNTAQQLLINSMKGIRKLSKHLSPLTLSSFGIIPTMNDLLEEFREEKKIKYAFDYPPDINHSLSADQQILLFRVLHLYLQFIGDNGGVTSIKLAIKKEANNIRFTIKHNTGNQVADELLPPSFSRIEMMLEAFNGSVNYHSKPGKGCTLEIIL